VDIKYLTIMQEEKTISKYHDLHVIIKSQPDEMLYEHLRKTILGTPGGLRYRHTDHDVKLRNIGESYFMLLYKLNRMLGSVGFCLRETYKASVAEKSWYIRYFSIHAPLRSGRKKSSKYQTDYDKSTGVLKAVVLPYFDNPDLLQDPKKTDVSRSVIYSYIDSGNQRSKEFTLQMGFEKIRIFSTLIYTRLKPRHFSYVKRISEPEKELVRNKLKEFYAAYTMFHDKYIFFDDNYYVVYENNEIAAGLQANPETWQIIEMGGFGGKILMKFLYRIPIIKKYINPESFDFLGVEGIWYKKEKAHYIADIIESVMAVKKCNIALTWQDIRSDVYKELMQEGKKGIMSRFFSSGNGEVYIKFISFNTGGKEEYFTKPAYLSAFDVT